MAPSRRNLAVAAACVVAVVAVAAAAAAAVGGGMATAPPPPPIEIGDPQKGPSGGDGRDGPPLIDGVDMDIVDRLDEIRKKTEEQEQNPDAGSNYDPGRPRDWITSGPFQIDRRVYAIGENVFIRTGVIPYAEKGQMAFYRQVNATHDSVYITIPFDGLDKDAFNQYFKPSLSPAKGTCTVDDIVGEWRVAFRGTGYQDIVFYVSDSMTVPGEEDNYVPVC